MSDREAAEKKAAEEKQKAEGKTAELLATREAELAELTKVKAELESKAKQFEESQKKIRDSALAKIKDPALKALAEKMPTVEDTVAFVETLESKKITPFAGGGKLQDGHTTDAPKPKNFDEAKAYYRKMGIAE